jgi:hypothetical protein
LKWQKEEEEQQKAAKNRKLVAQSSIKHSNSNGGINDKLNSFKDEINQQMNARGESSRKKAFFEA